jgi:hypothetical protein
MYFFADLADHPDAGYGASLWAQGGALGKVQAAVGVSSNWVEVGLNPATAGHTVMEDTGPWEGTLVARAVPLSPSYFRDLTGRVIYAGYGPERKTNAEWDAYRPRDAQGKFIDDDNPFVPLVTCPRYCEEVGDTTLRQLERVLLCHWRPLEVSLGFHTLLSGDGRDEEAELLATMYATPNLYPYKLRLDTFYQDGYKLPQTTYVFARGFAQGIDPARALKLGESDVLQAWQARAPGQSYEDWLEAQGGDKWRARLFQQGVTLVPTFEACNGFHVVGRQFELQDYWPGRAVEGVHEVVQSRSDEAPAGTILQVLQPGFVTGSKVVRAQVVVSDGSGYVSPNAQDVVPFVPNLFLPHQRTMADWTGCWLPTHPAHFEAPALWGWEPETGRFLQITGPIWDPLHYYYGCYEPILQAHDEATPRTVEGLVPVPPVLTGRFWPIVPLQGFDTFDEPTLERRLAQGGQLRSLLKRVPTPDVMAGIGYHPLPMEFEFELEPFWFQELHPVNRAHGAMPEAMEPFVAPLIRPRVGVEAFVASVDVRLQAEWCYDPARCTSPVDDPLVNYPTLTRYLLDDLTLEEVMQLCPMPFVGDLSEVLPLPVEQWWLDDEGQPLDTLAAWQGVLGGKGSVVFDALWDGRQKQAEIVRFRHLLWQTNLPLYTLGWWFGANVAMLQEMLVDWVYNTNPVEEGDEPAQGAANVGASASNDEGLSPEEQQQLLAMQRMRGAATTSRPTATQGVQAVEELAPPSARRR